MATEKLSARVATLESEVARLRNTLESEQAGEKPWWERIAGSFARDRIYQEAMKLGRQQQRAQKAPASKW